MSQILEITSGGERNVHLNVWCDIKANGVTYRPLKLLSISSAELYDENFAEVVMAELSIGLGTFNHDIFPYRDNIEMIVYKQPIKEVSDAEDPNLKIRSYKYRAVLVDESSAKLEASTNRASSKDAQDIGGIKTFTVQLLDPLIEQLRMKTAGGVLRKTNAGDALKLMLDKESKSLPLPTQELVKGVDIVTPYNAEMRDHMVINHGTRLTTLPNLFQDKMGGVYPTGIAHFIKDRIWYIFPRYDVKRFKKTPNTLTVINIPQDKMPGIERTFKQTPKRLVVLATGEVRHFDPSENRQLNEGNGVRFTDARKVLGGMGSVENNRLTIKRSDSTSEFVSEQRKTGLNNVLPGKQRFTVNAYAEMTALASRGGSYITLLWENSDPSLLRPGMPARLLYEYNGNVEEVYGLLVRAESDTFTKVPGITSKRYTTNTAITLFIGKKEK